MNGVLGGTPPPGAPFSQRVHPVPDITLLSRTPFSERKSIGTARHKHSIYMGFVINMVLVLWIHPYRARGLPFNAVRGWNSLRGMPSGNVVQELGAQVGELCLSSTVGCGFVFYSIIHQRPAFQLVSYDTAARSCLVCVFALRTHIGRDGCGNTN